MNELKSEIGEMEITSKMIDDLLDELENIITYVPANDQKQILDELIDEITHLIHEYRTTNEMDLSVEQQKRFELLMFDLTGSRISRV
jgi:hypothetical protein